MCEVLNMLKPWPSVFGGKILPLPKQTNNKANKQRMQPKTNADYHRNVMVMTLA